jgi:hypothetical protein
VNWKLVKAASGVAAKAYPLYAAAQNIVDDAVGGKPGQSTKSAIGRIVQQLTTSKRDTPTIVVNV